MLGVTREEVGAALSVVSRQVGIAFLQQADHDVLHFAWRWQRGLKVRLEDDSTLALAEDAQYGGRRGVARI